MHGDPPDKSTSQKPDSKELEEYAESEGVDEYPDPFEGFDDFKEQTQDEIDVDEILLRAVFGTEVDGRIRPEVKGDNPPPSPK